MEKSKKLLILQASPRKNGNLYKMAESLSEKYRVKGFETETVDVCALNFHRCIACMKCRSCGEPLRSLQGYAMSTFLRSFTRPSFVIRSIGRPSAYFKASSV